MKKNNIIIDMLLLFPIITHAQQTISASGGNATGSGGSVSYTVGQTAYNTYSGSGGSIVQGVQIPYEITVLTSANPSKNVNLNYSVYPNPTVDFLTLKIESENIKNFSASIFNLKGELLQSVTIEGRETKIDMLNYAPALYFLKVTENNKEVKTFKIIKN
jgi:hypothetical protein